MLHVETVFDFRNPVPYPVVTGIHDAEAGERIIVDLVNASDKETTWDQIEQKMLQIRDMLVSGTTFSCNDLKSHVRAFGMPPSYRYPALSRANEEKSGSEDSHAFINRRIDAALEVEMAPWNALLAGANIAYLHLEDRGISTGTKILHPVYSERFSGRHYTSGFNIQNAPADDGTKQTVPILPVQKGHNLFLQFDWSGAEPRIASLMSEDEEMQAHTSVGTLYSELVNRRRAQGLNESRDEVKVKLLASLYAMDVDDAITTYFPTFHAWMVDRVKHLRRNRWLETILGRRFHIDSEHPERSVFNAMLQGSVAHAMHSVLAKVLNRYPDNLFAEVHDSLILTCNDFRAEQIIEDVSQIMLRPFEGIMDSNPTLPLKVSIGRGWRKWEHYKAFNE